MKFDTEDQTSSTWRENNRNIKTTFDAQKNRTHLQKFFSLSGRELALQTSLSRLYSEDIDLFMSDQLNPSAWIESCESIVSAEEAEAEAEPEY